MISNRSTVHPAIHLLGSPTHLLFQLIKLTTLPYMVCQLIDHQKNKHPGRNKEQLARNQERSHPSISILPQPTSIRSSPSTSYSKPFQPSNLPPIRSINRPFSSDSSQNQFASSRSATHLFHHLIRHPNFHHQLLHQLDRFLELGDPPKLHPKTVDHLFFITRHSILDRLFGRHHHSKPRTSTSIAWQAEASNQIVQRWILDRPIRIQSNDPTNDTLNDDTPPRSYPSNSNHHDLKLIRKLDRLRARRRAFLLNGPPSCDCQRTSLPPKPVDFDRVGSLVGFTLGDFLIKFDRSITALTLLRIIDIARQAERWDLVVILLDRTRTGYRFDSRLNHRRLGQITGLLEFLRNHRSSDPDIDPVKIWSVNFICESLERSLLAKDHPHQEWARINRLSLDVLTRFAALPVGLMTSKSSTHDSSCSRKMRDRPMEGRWPLLDRKRHHTLLDMIGRSTNGLEFAVWTRERCERLLSKLTRIASHHPIRFGQLSYCWSNRSALQLRLLEYIARQGAEDQFISLLKIHLEQHPTGPKLARIILLGARRFKRLSDNPELIKQAISRLDLDDHRPLIDFMLRPNQSIETLSKNLGICLARLPIENEKRIRIYSHLIYRLSQLPSPSLALQVWDAVNSERSRRLIRGVGRRTRPRWKLLLKLKGAKPTKPVDELPSQLIRSMVYVFKNLTHSSQSSLLQNGKNKLAIGKNYRTMYQRLSFKTSNRRRRHKWPISRSLARTHLIFDLIKQEVKKVEDPKVLQSLESALISNASSHADGHHDHLNCFEGLVKHLILKNIKGSELSLIKRFDGLQMMIKNKLDLPEGRPDASKKDVAERSKSFERLRRKLKLYRFLSGWIKSRGRRRGESQAASYLSCPNPNMSDPLPRVPSKNQLNLFQRSFNLANTFDASPALDSYPPHRRTRRRSCSRYWARIVIQHSISSPPPA